VPPPPRPRYSREKTERVADGRGESFGYSVQTHVGTVESGIDRGGDALLNDRDALRGIERGPRHVEFDDDRSKVERYRYVLDIAAVMKVGHPNLQVIAK